MTTIYLVSKISMEPYEDYEDGPDRAFHTRKEAEKFLEDHDDVYEEGFFISLTLDAETNVKSHEDDEDAFYEYGWKYTKYIQEIELVSKGCSLLTTETVDTTTWPKVDCQQTKSTDII